MSNLNKNIFKLLAAFLVYAVVRAFIFTSVPIGSFETKLVTESGDLLHILLAYVLPVSFSYDFFKKVASYARARSI